MSQDKRPEWLDDEIARLPRQMSPSRDLWREIAARIERPNRSRALSWAAAAGVLLSAAALVFAYQSYRLQVQQADYALAAIEAVVAPYLAGRASRTELWSARRADTAPELATEIDRNLAILRTAQSQLRASLELDPDDANLIEMLRFTFQRELNLLQRASEVSTNEV